MKYFIAVLLALAFISAAGAGPSGAAGEIAGNWCRNDNGVLVDIISVAPAGEVYKVTLREGWDRPVYSEGVGSQAGGRFIATAKSATTPVIVHIAASFTDSSLSYSSYNLDGSFRWKGEYFRCIR